MIEPARLVLGPLVADRDPGWAERVGAIGYPGAKTLGAAGLNEPPPVPAPHRVTAIRVYRELGWFRVRGYGLWVKWGRRPDLSTTRKRAHYLGRLRWKILRPEG